MTRRTHFPEAPPARWSEAVAPATRAQRVAVGLLAHLLVTLLCGAAVVGVVILAPAQ